MERCDQTRIRPVAVRANINDRGHHVYHMPGDKFYSRTIISAAKGERWFCSADRRNNPPYVGPTQHGETSRSSGRPIRHLVSERSCVSARMRSCTWVWANVLENGRVVREVPADEVKRNARLREVCLGR